jgi:hypothetical protein
MCVGCWEKFGSPKIINAKTTKAVKLIDRVYDFSPVGGALQVQKKYWEDASLEQQAAEWQCLLFMKTLNLKERASALALLAGYLKKSCGA